MSSEWSRARDRRLRLVRKPNSGLAGHAEFNRERPQPMLTAGDFGASREVLTFFDVIVDHAARDQDRPAIVSLGSDPLSFRELVTHIGGIWDTLLDAGVGYGSQSGDRPAKWHGIGD